MAAAKGLAEDEASRLRALLSVTAAGEGVPERGLHLLKTYEQRLASAQHRLAMQVGSRLDVTPQHQLSGSELSHADLRGLARFACALTVCLLPACNLVSFRYVRNAEHADAVASPPVQ